jgi:hypothetical protein
MSSPEFLRAPKVFILDVVLKGLYTSSGWASIGQNSPGNIGQADLAAAGGSL